MNDLYYEPFSKAKELAAYEAILIKEKDKMLRESHKKYNSIIPILEQIGKYVYERIHPNPLRQLQAINGRIIPVDEPVVIDRILSDTPAAAYYWKNRAKICEQRKAIRNSLPQHTSDMK